MKGKYTYERKKSADNIKALRKQYNDVRPASEQLTQEALAEKLELSYSTYKKIESGQNNINIATLTALCDFYAVSADYILGYSTVKNHPDDPAYNKLKTMEEVKRKIKKEQKKLLEDYDKSIRKMLTQLDLEIKRLRDEYVNN